MRNGLVPPPGPLRTLALGSLVNSAGSGLLVVILVLYFTRIVGLSGGEVALGLTLGGGLGLLVGVPLGHLADARGARGLLLLLLVAQALATLAYVVVDSFAAFLVAALAVIGLDRGAGAVRQGVIARALPPEGRVRARAYLRSVTNAGFAFGSALATIGLAIDTKLGYQAMIGVDAVSFLVVAGLSRRLPLLPLVPAAESGPRLVVLRDRPYLAVIGLTAILALHDAMLDVGIPLWVSQQTDAPTAIVGVIFVLNCLSVTFFSMRLAAGSEGTADAARSAARAGITLVIACSIIATTGVLPGAIAAAVLVGAMLLQSVGEMQAAASQWGLSLGLAPEDRQGQYQGAASTGLAAARMLGPLVMAGIVALGPGGWVAFGVLMAITGAVTVPVTRWATQVRVATTV